MRNKYSFGMCVGWLSAIYGLFLILQAVHIGLFGELNHMERSLNGAVGNAEFMVGELDSGKSKNQVSHSIESLEQTGRDSIRLISKLLKFQIISGILFLFVGSYVERKSRMTSERA